METQKTVSDWCNRNYPDDTRNDMLRMLFEEATELSVAVGDITYDEIVEVVKQTWGSLCHDRGNSAHIPSGLADVQISLFDIADNLGIDVQQSLDEKMLKNRKDIGD